MKTFRVIEIIRAEGKKYQVQRWVEIKRNLFFGLWKRPSYFEWENVAPGVWMHGIGYLRFHETTSFDDITEAIAFCNNLNDNSKPKEVYSL